MTKTTKPAKPIETAANRAKAAIKDAAAREFLADQADSAQDGAAELNEQSAAQAEKATVSMIASYASFTQSLIDMTAANLTHAFSTVEKVAAAKSPTDAMKIQAAFVRDSSKANVERLQEVSAIARSAMAQATATARAAAEKALAQTHKAA